ncbi:hypothetical protein [Thalassotalea sp. PS06]|uniref:hypothetical protein n=1 Tax=Thalassotalea sp. PS06 TaxID=2594005 RepID=UPI0011636D7A|nr:hypothetical protein [Thalassotalea sp. PS06]QDP02439.1 hypothetical protein FNC98_14435 [Thalassotalea sp. PS06]
MRKLIVLISLLSLAGCLTTYRLPADAEMQPLKPDEGYFGLVFNSLDPLKNIQFKNMETGSEFYEGRLERGVHQMTLKVPAGEYCLVGFDVYDFRVDYQDKGFCTYVEAGEMNYFGEFIVRDPVTVASINFNRYVALLSKDHPEVCKEYIGIGC